MIFLSYLPSCLLLKHSHLLDKLRNELYLLLVRFLAAEFWCRKYNIVRLYRMLVVKEQNHGQMTEKLIVAWV